MDEDRHERNTTKLLKAKIFFIHYFLTDSVKNAPNTKTFNPIPTRRENVGGALRKDIQHSLSGDLRPITTLTTQCIEYKVVSG